LAGVETLDDTIAFRSVLEDGQAGQVASEEMSHMILATCKTAPIN